MSRYVIKFSKEGYIRYISHLDMLRLFKRAFKTNNVPLGYSQGFNPHPKMGFAQPLSLGYTATCEYIEFETVKPCDIDEIKEKMSASMPDGITILDAFALNIKAKSLASIVSFALYTVTMPHNLNINVAAINKIISEYLGQEEILAEKRQKKTKKIILKNIKEQIKGLECYESGNLIKLKMLLDCGSSSNLSPEAVIETFSKFAKIDAPRYEYEVNRDLIIFENNYIPG